MIFNNMLSESVIMTDEMKKVVSSLKKELLKEETMNKINYEIETNWKFKSIIDSITLTSTIYYTLLKFYPKIKVFTSTIIRSKGRLSGNKLTLNYKALAESSGAFLALRKNNKINYLNDFIIETIDTIIHEFVHYEQNDRSKIVPTVSNDKYYDSKKELMAFSAAIVDELKEKGYTKKEVYYIINHGEDEEGFVPSNRLANLKKYGSKNWNTFLKYCYDYIENHWKTI